VADLQGALEVANTNWTELAAAIAQDLDLVMPTGNRPAAPFYVAVPSEIPWAKFPLFPVTKVSAQAHRLLTILDSEEATFANEIHPKNESSEYRQMGDEDAAKMMARGTRLRSWLAEVLLRCANESRLSAQSEAGGPLERLQKPPPAFEHRAATSEQGGAPEVKLRPGKWIVRIGWVIGFAALCLFVLAIANVIARFPWISVLIALPWTLYLKFRNDS
jgi:hypothetical protein